ncbi:MAG: Transcriptional regulator, TetR family protein [Myxococcales bacterium]|nr:Transcriptional regulator, TetR family protein [Myxococcales bacterium]
MSRPTVISDERILEAAREVFIEQGIAATTAEVARRAGVAEGTIFKRFSTKAELFKAAMQVEFDDPDWLRTLIGARDEDDPREVLYQVGVQAVSFFRRLMPFIMMQWSTGKKHGVPDQLLGPNSPPLRALKALSVFIERQIRSGQMRKTEPEIVARMLLGSIQSYVFFEILLRAQAKMPLPVEPYLRGLINVLWTGVEPAPKRGH